MNLALKNKGKQRRKIEKRLEVISFKPFYFAVPKKQITFG